MLPFANDVWLTETMARPVYRWTGRVADTPATQLSDVMRNMAGGGDAFFFAKSASSDVSLGAALTASGFSLVDTTVTFAWAGSDVAAPSGVSVGPAQPEQHPAIVDLAGRVFRWSRFHLDPWIPLELANHVKRRWIENYCQGRRGSALYSADVEGVTAGFLAVMETKADGRSVAVIDLVGVAPEFQGRGVGLAMTRFFIDAWKERATELRVGTQVANIRSLRFYERAGFRVVDSGYVFHAHYAGGELLR